MRKLKLQMQMTINGYVSGLNGETEWMTWNPDPELIVFMSLLLDTSDTILIGRKAADGFIDHWDKEAVNNPAHPFATKISAMPKILFSKTLNSTEKNNTTLAKGDLAAEVKALKNQTGKDMIVFGGADFAASLIKENLIDEYHLIINPTVMASGMTIFHSLDAVKKFTPVSSRLYPGGKTVLSFKPATD